MSEPTLELSQHELYFLPPGTPAVAPATRVEVDGKVFLARWERCVFKDGPEISSIFYAKEEVGAGIFVFESDRTPSESKVTEQEKVDWTKVVIANGNKNRHWKPLDKPFTVTFRFFQHSNLGFVSWRADNSLKVSVSFRFGLPQENLEIDLSQCPQRKFLECCEQLLADEDTELNYAVRWKELTTEAKDLIAFRCEYGDWETLQRLFALVQIVVTHQFGSFPPSPRGKSPWNFDRDLIMRPTKASGWATRWRAVICEIMLPSFWPDEPRCVSVWRGVETSHREMNQVRCTTPTHHEFLEAQLELREFLRPHLPAAEIEALFVPDAT